jgi:hypothetical protein
MTIAPQHHLPEAANPLVIHVMQAELFVDGLEDAQLLVGSGDMAALKVQAQPAGPWRGAAAPDCSSCAAFVVGVASYPAPFQLPVCRTDAEDMAWLLHRKGYNVTRLVDPTHAQLWSSFVRFLEQLHCDTTVVIHFAGHGVQLAGANYLVPVDGVELPSGGEGERAVNTLVRALEILPKMACGWVGLLPHWGGGGGQACPFFWSVQAQGMEWLGWGRGLCGLYTRLHRWEGGDATARTVSFAMVHVHTWSPWQVQSPLNRCSVSAPVCR